jgi:hypothetical protein
MTNDIPNFSHHTGIREASLLLVREKSGRYTLLREPLYLDRCIICTESDWEDYFEVQEILTKDTFIFKVSIVVVVVCRQLWMADSAIYHLGESMYRRKTCELLHNRL